MLASCCGLRGKEPFEDYASGRGMDQLQVELSDGRPGTLRCNDKVFELLARDTVLLTTAIHKVLDVKLHGKSGSSTPGSHDSIGISLLVKARDHHRLETRQLKIVRNETVEVEGWVSLVLKRAYAGTPRGRKVRLLVNPIGGQGKAVSLVNRLALPVFKAAGCEVEVIETQYGKHAEEIARNMSLDCDVLAAASGDGIIHELINGLASREDAEDALKIPVVPIPTGSANGMSINLLGLEEGFDIPLAVLNVIKGRVMPLDLCSVTAGTERRFSFMSIAMGLMCEVDLGTEHLRWLGDTRFIYGFVRGIVYNSPMQCTIHVKVDTADKGLMIQRLNETRQAQHDRKGHLDINLESTDVPEATFSAIPPVRMLEPDSSWISMKSGTNYAKPEKKPSPKWPVTGSWSEGEAMLYVYTGLQPYVARDLMQFPACIPGEGLMDVVVQSLVPRQVLAQSITGAAEGKQFYLDSQHYYKGNEFVMLKQSTGALTKSSTSSFTASAFVVELEGKNSLVSVDGEALQATRLSVEVIPKLARTLSLYGTWAESKFGAAKA